MVPTGMCLCDCLGRERAGGEDPLTSRGKQLEAQGAASGVPAPGSTCSHLLDSCVLASPLILLSKVLHVLVHMEVRGTGRRAGPVTGMLQEEA